MSASGREHQFPALPDCCQSSNEALRPKSAYWRARILTLSATCCRWPRGFPASQRVAPAAEATRRPSPGRWAHLEINY